MKIWAKLVIITFLVDALISATLGYVFGNPSRDWLQKSLIVLLIIWAGGFFYQTKGAISAFIARKILKNDFENAMYDLMEKRGVPYSYNGHRFLIDYYNSAHPTDYFSEILMEGGHSQEEREAAQLMIGLCNGFRLGAEGKNGACSRFNEGMKTATLRYAEDKKYQLQREELHT